MRAATRPSLPPGPAATHPARRATPGKARPAAPSAAATTAAIPAHRIAWHACGHRLQCAHVLVPLNWARPHGPVIALAVIRYGHRRRAPSARCSLTLRSGAGGVALVRRSGPARGRRRALQRLSWDRAYPGQRAGRCFRTPAAAARFWRGAQLPFSRPAGPRTAATIAAWPAGVNASAARCSRTCPLPIPRGISTTCGRGWATAGLPTLFPSARSSARCTRPCFLAGSGDGVDSVVARSRARDAEARTISQVSSADQVFRQFLGSARPPGRAGARWPVITRAWPRGYSPVPARPARAEPHRTRRRPALSYGDLLLSVLTAAAACGLAAPGRRPRGRGRRQRLGPGTAARPLRSAAGWMAGPPPTIRRHARPPAAAGLAGLSAAHQRRSPAGAGAGVWLWAQCAASRARDAYRYAGHGGCAPGPRVLLIHTSDPRTRLRRRKGRAGCSVTPCCSPSKDGSPELSGSRRLSLRCAPALLDQPGDATPWCGVPGDRILQRRLRPLVAPLAPVRVASLASQSPSCTPPGLAPQAGLTFPRSASAAWA